MRLESFNASREALKVDIVYKGMCRSCSSNFEMLHQVKEVCPFQVSWKRSIASSAVRGTRPGGFNRD